MLGRSLLYILPLTASLASASVLPATNVLQVSQTLGKRNQEVLAAADDEFEEVDDPVSVNTCWSMPDGSTCCRNPDRSWNCWYPRWANVDMDALFKTLEAPSGDDCRTTGIVECCKDDNGNWACHPHFAPKPPPVVSEDVDESVMGCNYYSNGWRCCDNGRGGWFCVPRGGLELEAVEASSKPQCHESKDLTCCKVNGRWKCHRNRRPPGQKPVNGEIEQEQLSEDIIFEEEESDMATGPRCFPRNGRWYCIPPASVEGQLVEETFSGSIPKHCIKRLDQICCLVSGKWVCQKIRPPVEEIMSEEEEISASRPMCYKKLDEICCKIRGKWVCKKVGAKPPTEELTSGEDELMTPPICYKKLNQVCCKIGGKWVCKKVPSAVPAQELEGQSTWADEFSSTKPSCHQTKNIICCKVHRRMECHKVHKVQPTESEIDALSAPIATTEKCFIAEGGRICCYARGAWTCTWPSPNVSEESEVVATAIFALESSAAEVVEDVDELSGGKQKPHCIQNKVLKCCRTGRKWHCKKIKPKGKN